MKVVYSFSELPLVKVDLSSVAEGVDVVGVIIDDLVAGLQTPLCVSRLVGVG